MSLVSYAGHGIEMDGVNCLEPLDARLERDVDGCLETGVERGRVAAAGDPGRVPEQLARAVDAADGGDAHGERWELRRSERGLARERDADGLCGGNDGGPTVGAEQPVHDGVPDAPGPAAGVERDLPTGASPDAGGDGRDAASARVRVATGKHYLSGAPGAARGAPGRGSSRRGRPGPSPRSAGSWRGRAEGQECRLCPLPWRPRSARCARRRPRPRRGRPPPPTAIRWPSVPQW